MPNRKPNLLLIVLDTLRRDQLTIYGAKRPTSPGFDAFAGRAALFERAVSPAQWTIPAHASLFTGLYPGAHGLTQANGRLNPMHATLAEILQADGYHTAAFCNNPLVGAIDHGMARGFDRFFNYATAVPYRPYTDDQTALARAFTTWFRPYARRIGNWFATSDDLFRIALHRRLTPLWARTINFKGNTATSVDDLLRYWADRHAGGREQPLFAFVNLMGAHLPYHPPAALVARFDAEVAKDKAAQAFMRRFNADGAAWASPPEQPFSDLEARTLAAHYQAEIAAQDEQLDRLLAGLRARGAFDDTAIVVLADHGESHGDHAIMGHGFGVFQELVHVPMALHLPGVTSGSGEGQHIGANISTRRLFHTLIDLAGAPTPLSPDDPNANIGGLSLAPLLAASSAAADADGGLAFSEAYPPSTFLKVLEHRSPSTIDRLRLRLVRRAVYAGDRKLVTEAGRATGLFNLKADPAELADLASAQPREADALLHQVEAFTAAQAGGEAQAETPLTAEVADHLRALGYID